MSQFILSIDQGTTSSRALIFNESGSAIGVAQKEFTQYFPNDGWVEHDPEEIWASTLEVCKEVISQSGLDASSLSAIGITNQRETTIVWDRHTGKSVYPAIVWQDRRTADFCEELKAAGYEQKVRQCTGLLIDPYFSATKIAWILKNVDGAQERAEAGDLIFGTVDTFLLWRLTGGKSHYTDATNASRTMIFDIQKQCWDEDLLSLLNIPKQMLPEVKDSSADFGDTASEVLGAEIPIAGMAGDQQAAMFGQACFNKGMAKSTYGTGCFLMLNTGADMLLSENSLLTTVAYRLNGQTTYALEGSIFIAGAVMQWLRDGIHLIENAAQSEQMAEDTGYFGGVSFVPAFTGLGAPYWDPKARGAITGLTRDTGIKEIVTAALMSVGLQTLALVKSMAEDGADFPSQLRVDGGMVVNNWLSQSLADLLQTTVDRPANVETTALGAAYLAGLQIGVFDSLEQIAEHWRLEHRFEPKLEKGKADKIFESWEQELKKVLSN